MSRLVGLQLHRASGCSFVLLLFDDCVQLGFDELPRLDCGCFLVDFGLQLFLDQLLGLFDGSLLLNHILQLLLHLLLGLFDGSLLLHHSLQLFFGIPLGLLNLRLFFSCHLKTMRLHRSQSTSKDVFGSDSVDKSKLHFSHV